MFAAITRITRSVDVPVTADIEAGYGLAPGELAGRLADAGVVGCNLEDSDPVTRELADPGRQADYLAAVHATAGEALVINARVDVFVRPRPDGAGDAVEDAVERARRYYESKYGVTVVASESLGATDAYTIGKMDAGVAQAALGRIDGREVDALVVPGGNFPTLDRIVPWEQQFGKPVITTNQAALWAVLQTMKFDTPLPGKGRLLEQLPAG